ncbi:unnamed protein product [Rotaria sp. Silwood1]|nr:unnamed protein product [Rotaria sp. Silwood1]CAF1423201.1 unnamed protein product [Rotaria sp. Silwood1]CAF4683957.1 unnamed protein product [Rotaria sp. Silwood1]
MSFLSGHCCSKLNYLICCSKTFSSEKKKKKFNLRQEAIANRVCLNNKIINKNESSSITLNNQNNINIRSLNDTLQQQNSRETNLKYNKDIQTTKNASYESLINSSVDNRLFDNYCPTINNDIIIKEVIINRNYPNERLGLTLCYGITSTSTINVYIEQVEKNSLADRQGQLQVGDQIIKINNHQVTNRDQTIHLVNGASKIILQIIRFKSTKINSSNVESQLRRSALKKSDSGVILASNTDFETNNQFIYKKCLNQYNLIRKISTSLTCLAYENCSNCHHNLLYSQQIKYRRCLSLNDLKICRIIEENLDYSKSIRKDLINCQEEFKIKKNYEKSIIKPLSFNDHHDKVIERYFSYLKEDIDHSHYDKYRLNKNRQYENNRICKNNRRRYRKPNLKEKNPLLITTNDDTISQLKQNPYLIKEQRKKQFQRSKISKERFGLQENLINSITEDFNLLNRIFLHENEQELKEKPYLAIKYQQESISEKEKLEKILQQYEIDHPLRLQSTQNRTIYSTENNLSTVII